MNDEDCFHIGVKALIRNKNNDVLLLHANKKNPYWDLPGGRIRRKESMEMALKREVFEETSLNNLSITSPFLTVISNVRIPMKKSDVGLVFAIYLCQSEDSVISLSDEHKAFDWFSPQKAALLLEHSYPKEFINKLSSIKKIL